VRAWGNNNGLAAAAVSWPAQNEDKCRLGRERRLRDGPNPGYQRFWGQYAVLHRDKRLEGRWIFHFDDTRALLQGFYSIMYVQRREKYSY
jgi:hypothetical protein